MPEQVGASHILITHTEAPEGTATRTRDEALAEIERIQGELEDGSDFSELARSHSDCPSQKKDGYLGLFRRGQMVPSFETAVFALEVGDKSGIVETDFGYHIIFRNE